MMWGVVSCGQHLGSSGGSSGAHGSVRLRTQHPGIGVGIGVEFGSGLASGL